MGTNSQRISFETEVDVNVSDRCDHDMSIVSVKGLKANWQSWSSDHQENQKLNPFSHDTRQTVGGPQRGQGDYGRPQQGSLIEKSAKEASMHIDREVQKLCEVIRNIGEVKEKEGKKVATVEFGNFLSITWPSLLLWWEFFYGPENRDWWTSRGRCCGKERINT